jgi:hypothetical protein
LHLAKKGVDTIVTYHNNEDPQHERRLLSIPTPDRFPLVLNYLLDENKFLSPSGIRSPSKVHQDNPYSFWVNDREYRVGYTPGEQWLS